MNKFDTHIHTIESPCCVSKTDIVVDTAEKAGLHTIVIKDHDTTKGALQAKRDNEVMKKRDSTRKLIIELGDELTTEIGEIGVSFLHPDECDIFERNKNKEGKYDFETVAFLIAEMRKNIESRILVDLHHPISKSRFNKRGGFNFEMALQKGYFKNMEELMQFFNTVELNGSNLCIEEGEAAIELGKEHNKPIVFTSDSHNPWQIGTCYTETDEEDIQNAILNNNIVITKDFQSLYFSLVRFYRVFNSAMKPKLTQKNLLKLKNLAIKIVQK